ncbi:hypothetical protein [Actinophytocola xanthii]|uniref:Peptidase inhibitor family I36 n=1 Tax=Actinophytocola xanthii TaxID=1912961 RepID=A0A1Q8CPK8_9PSEU|nr:hypothetical protein [Actinophytocola xanthii]OLF16294.1 hypothetical protein BU204_17040 [Actinophytocola xanthii]
MVRRIALVGAAVLGFTAILPATSVQAIPKCRSGYNCLYQWYADPAHTTFVGFLSIDCEGNTESSGGRSQHLHFTESPCG